MNATFIGNLQQLLLLLIVQIADQAQSSGEFVNIRLWIFGVFGHERSRQIEGEYESFPWTGRFWKYGNQNGMIIP